MNKLCERARQLLRDAQFDFACIVSEEADPGSGVATLVVRALDVPNDQSVEQSETLTRILFKLFIEGDPCVSMTISPENSQRFRDLARDGEGVLWRPRVAHAVVESAPSIRQLSASLSNLWSSPASERAVKPLRQPQQRFAAVAPIAGLQATFRWQEEWPSAAGRVDKLSAKFSEAIENQAQSRAVIGQLAAPEKIAEAIARVPRLDLSEFVGVLSSTGLQQPGMTRWAGVAGWLRATMPPLSLELESAPSIRSGAEALEYSQEGQGSTSLVSYSSAA